MNLKYLWYQAVVEHRFPYIILQVIFIPLSLVYRLGLSIRHLAYWLGIKKSVKLPCRVISVGNITVGGTGKTPLVMYLAKMLDGHTPSLRDTPLQRGFSGKKVAILARGYGRLPGGDDEALASDIPNVIRIAQPDRLSAAHKLIEQGIDTIILDDGFQHWRIKRQVRPKGGLTVPTEGDLDIVVIDSTNPFGNGLLLPAGILREPLSALKRASMFVLTHTDSVKPEEVGKLEDYLRSYQKPIIKTVHQPVELISLVNSEKTLLEKWKSLSVYGFCGIGTPAHFRRTLQELFTLAGFESFPDHYNYSADDITTLVRRASEAGAKMLVTTQKDALRVKAVPQFQEVTPPINFLRVELKVVAGEDALKELICVR